MVSRWGIREWGKAMQPKCPLRCCRRRKKKKEKERDTTKKSVATEKEKVA